MEKIIATKNKLAVLLFLALISFCANRSSGQDSDGDGWADSIDCKPLNPCLYASVIYIDRDGDNYFACISGCFGGTLPILDTFLYGYPYQYGYYYEIWGQGFDCDDYDPMNSCRIASTSCEIAADSDNDGESDITDPFPNDPLKYHGGPGCSGCTCSPGNCNFTVDAGPDEHLLFGYAPSQCKTKTVAISGGSGPFTYAWTLNRALLPGETLTGAGTASATVCLLDTAELCVTVSDATCSTTDCSMIFAEDVRCPAGNSGPHKITICHNNHTICVDSNAVAAHLAHGDLIGGCAAASTTGGTPGEQNLVPGFSIFPNPAGSAITIRSRSANPIGLVSIFDASGKLVLQTYTPEVQITINLQKFSGGLYYLRVGRFSGRTFIKK